MSTLSVMNWTITNLIITLLYVSSTLQIIMEQVNFNYSTKNIPIPRREDYMKRMIEKTEKFMHALDWRVYCYLNPKCGRNSKETYGFRTTKSPPFVQETKEFKDEWTNILQNIEFTDTSTSKFQRKLAQDARKIRKDDKMFIPADKTTNFYKLEPKTYEKLLEENITKTYKKSNNTSTRSTNLGNKKIATKLELADRINRTAENEAFLTLKDHKPNFRNKPTCRLINPSKSEIGIISKQKLENINNTVRQTLQLNQWKNTNDVIEWFKKIEQKQHQSFIGFDICEFYPSITEELLDNAITFASEHVQISEETKEIMKQAKKSFLFHKESPWNKRNNNDLFDITMGSYDGAETCELVGLFILSKLSSITEIKVGLYRDDGLATCQLGPRQTEQAKKKICQIFNELGLRVTIEANKKIIDFLDITLDLGKEQFKPYMKPNNTPLYVHKDSNHPQAITKNIPESINKRLSNISSNEETFDQSAPPYQEALQKSGYNFQLKYAPPQQPSKENQKRKRTRNITWFNPPYSINVKTNVGKRFLQLIDKCFPATHKLHKLLNRNTIKVSYSCMPNMKQTISAHNKTLLNKTRKSHETDESEIKCNCRKKSECPITDGCLTSSVVYQATVTRQDNNKEETYIGLTENSFKSRYYGHTSSFKNPKYRTSTTLSQYVWDLKDNNIPHTIKWKIISKCQAYSPISKRCNLCITEKYFIICRPELSTLNNRSELTTPCKHRHKYLLCNLR